MIVSGRWTVLVVWLLLGLAAGGSVGWGSWHALTKSDDLVRRSEEVRIFLDRQDPYRDPDMTYPPTALPVFTALIGPWPAGWVKAFWLGLNLAALTSVCASVLWLWAKDWTGRQQGAFVLIVAASKPVRLGIGLGQFHLVPLALLLLSVVAMSSRRPLLAGLCVGVALAKPTMVLPFLAYLAARGSWRTLATALAVQVIALVGVSSWLGIPPGQLIGSWLEVARGQESAGLVDLPSVVQRYWPNGGAVLGRPLMLVALCSSTALLVAYRNRPGLALVSFACFSAAIFTYHRPYDLVLLLPALALAVDRARRSRGGAPLVLLGVFILVLVVPADPLVHWGVSGLYDGCSIVVTYALLAWTTCVLVAARGHSAGDAPQPGPAPGGEGVG
jgi:hypothetical protein